VRWDNFVDGLEIIRDRSKMTHSLKHHGDRTVMSGSDGFWSASQLHIAMGGQQALVGALLLIPALMGAFGLDGALLSPLPRLLQRMLRLLCAEAAPAAVCVPPPLRRF